MPTPCNLTITGIPGGSEKDGREGSSDVFEIEHQVHQRTDAATGMSSGSRVHAPMRVTKQIDKASPRLFEALCRNENLEEVKLDFYRIDPESRSEVKYYTITMTNCRVSHFRPYMPVSFLPANESFRHMEQVSFIYEQIELQWLPDNIVAIDMWRAAGEGADRTR